MLENLECKVIGKRFLCAETGIAEIMRTTRYLLLCSRLCAQPVAAVISLIPQIYEVLSPFYK